MPRYGFAQLHCHSDHSLNDSPMKVKALVKAAAESGASAVALTDHGTCTGWVEFMKCCRAEGVNGIPGVEAYIDTGYSGKAHLVLLAKNYEGYREISRFITDANKNLVRNYGDTYVPVSPMGKLREFFGHGNVIAMTACINGMLGSVYMSAWRAGEKRDKILAQMEGMVSPGSPEYIAKVKERDAWDSKVAELVKARDETKKTAEKKYKARMNGLKSLGEGSAEWQSAKTKLDAEMAETEVAKAALPDIKKQLKDARSARTRAGQACSAMEERMGRHKTLAERAEALADEAVDDAEAYRRVLEILGWLKSVFGDDLYVEVQYHGMEAEEVIYPASVKAARELGVPLIATNDSHIAKREDAEARAFMHALAFKRWEPPSLSDCELCIKTEDEIRESLLGILPADAVDEAMANAGRVGALCRVKIPEGDHYPHYIENGKAAADAGALLEQRAREGIAKLFPGGTFTQEYEDRLEYELSVIRDLGYSDYTLIVADTLNYAMGLSCTNSPEGVGYGTGPGRGSGAGSLVNYLMGITKLDPVKNGLLFERYLNKDRVSNPDIDSDYSDEVRDSAIRHSEKKYGSGNVAGIRTTITQSAKAAVRNSARVRGYELYPDPPGGLKGEERKALVEKEEEGRRRTARIGDAICKEIPAKPGTKLLSCLPALNSKFSGEDEKVILRRALEVEGTITSTGMHAAGIIIGDGKPLQEYVPLSYNRENNKWITQCDMVEAEEMGLLKIDFLGLNNLDIITECIRRVKREYGLDVNPDRLPFEDEIFREVFAKGETDCVFQFESGGMKRMLKEFHPECFEDIVLLVAAYRPGPMDFIPEIIQVKKGLKKPRYILKELEDILAPTYGQPIYQEQLMNIFHVCAGFSLGEADIVRRYMSKKKVDAFLAYKPKFIDGVVSSGASAGDAEELWDSLEGFALYGFNKSHAAAYAMVSYQTAWLKYHYPLQYMCSMLNHPSKSGAAPGILTACRNMGVKVLPPDINLSQATFEEEQGAIRFGLGTVRDVSSWAADIVEERNANGAFAGFPDFMLRWQKNSKVTEALIKAGAFDSGYRETYGGDVSGTVRNEMLDFYRACVPYAKKIKKCREAIEEIIGDLPAAKSVEKKKLEARKSGREADIKKCMEEIESMRIIRAREDPPGLAARYEMEMLGAPVSCDPLESYAWIWRQDDVALSADIEPGMVKCAGMVTSLRTAKRKSDGAGMCFFSLEDPAGKVDVACFAREYEKYGELIAEGMVLYVYGKASQDEYQGESRLQVAAKYIRLCSGGGKYVLVTAPDRGVFEQHLPEIKAKVQPGGYRVLFMDKSLKDGHLEDTRIFVSFGDTLVLEEA